MSLENREHEVEKALAAKVKERENLEATIASKKKRDPRDETRRQEIHAVIVSLQREQADLTKRIKELRKRHREIDEALQEKERKQLLTDYSPEAFDTCPVSHVVGLVLDDCRDHGIVFGVISADRRDGIAQRFGHSSQAQCYYGHLAGNPAYPNPANPPNSSTHEYWNGGNGGTPAFSNLPTGARLDASKLGLDLRSNGEASAFCWEAKKLGYEAFQPYNSGSELHHVCIRSNPVPNLIKRGRV